LSNLIQSSAKFGSKNDDCLEKAVVFSYKYILLYNRIFKPFRSRCQMSNNMLEEEDSVNHMDKGGVAKYELKINHLNELNRKLYA
jgi:hypothetical protein